MITGGPRIVRSKCHAEPSVLSAQLLLERSREVAGLPGGRVPAVCVLDPDGVLPVRREPPAAPSGWACFHTELEMLAAPVDVGVVSHAVGGSFSVLVGEQLAAMGCRLIVSMASVGALDPALALGSFVVMTAALRDEGTSYHYLPPNDWVLAEPTLVALAAGAAHALDVDLSQVRTWTTDAPYRETRTSIEAARHAGASTVEMEAAGLYAFGAARGAAVVCIGQVTNRLGQDAGDFWKPASAPARRLAVLVEIVQAWLCNTNRSA